MPETRAGVWSLALPHPLDETQPLQVEGGRGRRERKQVMAELMVPLSICLLGDPPILRSVATDLAALVQAGW